MKTRFKDKNLSLMGESTEEELALTLIDLTKESVAAGVGRRKEWLPRRLF